MIVRLLVCKLLFWRAVVGRRFTTVLRPHRVVATTQGEARGYFAPDPPHHAFLGLPYARPPTRYDRFKAPEPPPVWDGVFDATYKVRCPQAAGGEENCLVVNVFVPETADALPVLVHVHDGGFQSGWGAQNPPKRLLREGFVVVTFNYRLGVLGFLCLGHHEAPGNAGLKDQVAALYWVQRNIEAFGGNPADVTLYGSGSGAAAAEFLLITGFSRGLFHKIILESGSVLSPLSMMYEPIATAFDVATELGYEGDNTDVGELVEFYLTTRVKKLVNTSKIFLPCIEKSFYNSNDLIPGDPMEILKKGEYDKIPIIISYTNLEGLSFGERSSDLNTPPQSFEDLLPNNLEFDTDLSKSRVAESIRELYFDNDDEAGDNYMDYIGDITTVYPAVKSATIHALNGVTVYLMMYIHSFSEEDVMNEKIFDIFFLENNMDNSQRSTILMTLFENFIRYHDPTPLTTSLIPVIWPPLPAHESTNMADVPCLIFGSILHTSELMSAHLAAWEHVYDKYYKTHSDVEEPD